MNYRRCLYGLAMDIGDKIEIYRKFNESMLRYLGSVGYRENVQKMICGIDANSDERKISMLNVLNELESFIVFSINEFEGLEVILRNAESRECSDLADKLRGQVRSEVDTVKPRKLAKKVNSIPYCLFLRNGILVDNMKPGEGLLTYMDAKAYISTLEKMGIVVGEYNNRFYEDFWGGLREQLTDEVVTSYEYFLIIMIGYSNTPPLEDMFMMNVRDTKYKEIGCFDILDGLYKKLDLHFPTKKFLVVNLTQPVIGNHKEKFDKFLRDKKIYLKSKTPRNFGYLHLHAQDNQSMAELLKEDFTGSWIKSPNMLNTLKRNSEFIPNIKFIHYCNKVNTLDEFQSDSIDNSDRDITKMVIYKIRVNGSYTEVCRTFTNDLEKRSDSYYLFPIVFNCENGVISNESIENLTKKLKSDSSTDKPFDFYTFVICSEEVPSNFYERAVQACYFALNESGQLSRPKLILIDAVLRANESIWNPKEIAPETIIISSSSRPQREEDSVISLLTRKLEDDLHNQYDLLTHLTEAFNISKNHIQSFWNSLSKPVYLVSNST